MNKEKDKLALLRAYLGDDTLQIKEMLELFLESVPGDLEKLSLFCKSNDGENIGKMAHRIKSSVKFFGLVEVGDILQRMERLSKENLSDNQLEILDKQVNELMNHELGLLRKEFVRLEALLS